MLPDAHGLILTDDGAKILFSLQGRTSWVGTGAERRGHQVLVAMFEAEDERYQWLNDTLCIVEGVIDPKSLIMRASVYACIHEKV